MTLGGETSQTLSRGIGVLEQLSRSGSAGMSVSQLATALGVGRPVVYRLVATLSQHGLVRRFDDGQIHLGLGLLPLAAGTHSGIRKTAQPILRTLADEVGATAHLTIADGEEAMAVAVETPRWGDYHVSYRVGSTHAVTRGAAGKAIIAGRAGDDRLVLTAGELQAGARGYAIPVLGLVDLQASVGVVTVVEVDEATIDRQIRGAVQAFHQALT